MNWRNIRERLFKLRMICGIGGIICILVSVIVAYRGARRSYRPIGNMVSRLQLKAQVPYDEKTDTELEFIEALWARENQENDRLNRKIRHSEDIRLERFLCSLLEGSTAGDISGDNIFVKNGMELCSDKFYVAVIQIAQNTRMDADMLAFIIRNVFKELAGRNNKGYVLSLYANRYVLMINLKESETDEELAELLREGKEFLERHYQMTISAGASRIHEGMSGIHMAYEEANTALGYQYILGQGSLIRYEQIGGREFQYPVSAESKLSGMLMGYLKDNGNLKSASRFTAEIMELYEINEDASLETVECFKFEIIGAVNKAAVSSGYTAAKRKELIKELLDKPSLDEFQEGITELLTVMRAREQEHMEQDDVCRQAYIFIEQNYMLPDLSVALLGSRFHISASYLSRLFREKYGINIPDHIAQTRIQNARAALRNCEKSIQEIAEETGFLSSNVFIKTFKKWEGITPGVYRKLSEQEGGGGK